MATAITSVPSILTAEEYAVALESLGPEPEGDDRYEPQNWPRWIGKKTLLGEEPGEGHVVQRVAARGSSVTVSTEDRYRIIEVPSGRVLYELKTLWEVASEVDTISGGREQEDDPYAIGVSYELVAAMERQSELTWEDISLRPPLVYCKCRYCGSDRHSEANCGKTGYKNSDEHPLKRTDRCRERELERIRAVERAILAESRLLGEELDFESSQVIDDRYQWEFPPDMSTELNTEADVERQRELHRRIAAEVRG